MRTGVHQFLRHTTVATPCGRKVAFHLLKSSWSPRLDPPVYFRTSWHHLLTLKILWLELLPSTAKSKRRRLKRLRWTPIKDTCPPSPWLHQGKQVAELQRHKLLMPFALSNLIPCMQSRLVLRILQLWSRKLWHWNVVSFVYHWYLPMGCWNRKWRRILDCQPSYQSTRPNLSLHDHHRSS